MFRLSVLHASRSVLSGPMHKIVVIKNAMLVGFVVYEVLDTDIIVFYTIGPELMMTWNA
jgi:hypothetical protein